MTEILTAVQASWHWLAAHHPVLITLLAGGVMLWLMTRHD
ncbi:Uncharacterised protein [Citrobacter koseri]|nr:Uncharacterised protein [Citrobacter koseri]STT23463.1 Uncharacterised protein [Citrobacter koseri]